MPREGKSRLRNACQSLTELAAAAICSAVALWLPQRLPTARADVAAQAPAATPIRPHDGRSATKAVEIASYALDARLDASTHQIFGKGTITWRNASRVATDELWLHLYLNAFKNERTLYLRSPFKSGRSGDRAARWGYIDVKRLAAREFDGVDLWPRRAKHSPGDPDDETDIRLPLPRPVEPGETLTLEVEFVAQLPSIVERTGVSGSFHFAGQWFPKLARLEPDGTWAHFAYHPQAEYYADFGRYEVSVDVPSGFVLGATGRETARRTEGERQRVTFVAESVHDFAWTAWDGFQEQSERIDGVDVRLLYPDGHDTNARVTLASLRHALPLMNARYGRYPHPTLTVVHPPQHAANAGGMEYPTLITTGGPWYAPLTGIRAVESVTVHELAHQWFQGIVASDERSWPFLDEGLTTWVEGDLMRDAHGAASLIAWPDLSIAAESARRAAAAHFAHQDAIAQPADRFASFDAIGGLVYARTGTLLDTLANVHGRDRVRRALGNYARRSRFEHPSPKVLLAALRDEFGDDAADTISTALFERGWVDFVAGRIESVSRREAAGVFDRAGGRETVEDGEQSGFVSRVRVMRHGTLRFPVEVELVFADGSSVRRSWDGRGTWTNIEQDSQEPLVAVRVDPDLRIALDQDLSNNFVAARTPRAPRTLERTAYLAALALAVGGP